MIKDQRKIDMQHHTVHTNSVFTLTSTNEDAHWQENIINRETKPDVAMIRENCTLHK